MEMVQTTPLPKPVYQTWKTVGMEGVKVPALELMLTRMSIQSELSKQRQSTAQTSSSGVALMGEIPMEMIEFQHFAGYTCRLRDMRQCNSIVQAYGTGFEGMKRIALKHPSHVKPNWEAQETFMGHPVNTLDCDLCHKKIDGRPTDDVGHFYLCRKCKSKSKRFEVCNECYNNMAMLKATTVHFAATHPATVALTMFLRTEEADPIYSCAFCGRQIMEPNDPAFICPRCDDTGMTGDRFAACGNCMCLLC